MMIRTAFISIAAAGLLTATFVAPCRAVDIDPELLAAEAARVAVMAEARGQTVAVLPPEPVSATTSPLVPRKAVRSFIAVRPAPRARTELLPAPRHPPPAICPRG